MFRKIGTGESGAPLILAEFNPAEKMAFGEVLWSAAQAIEGRDGDDVRITRLMIGELRRVFEIED